MNETGWPPSDTPRVKNTPAYQQFLYDLPTKRLSQVQVTRDAAPHTFDLVLVRCVKDEDEPGDPPRDVAFVWRDPSVSLPSGGAPPAA